MTPSDSSGPSVRSLYQQIILDHYRNPRNRGELTGTSEPVHKLNPTCGDEIHLQVDLVDGRIEAGRFSGQGCSISQASASMMTELLTGRSPDEARALSERFREMLHGSEEAASDRALGDLRALAGVARFPTRVRCAMLCWEALDEALP